MEGTDDKQDWQEVMEAMNIMNMSETEQFDIIRETLNLFLTSFKIFLMWKVEVKSYFEMM